MVLDFETTGLSCERHRVIEIGAAIVNWKGDIVDTYQSLCLPPLLKKLPKFISKFTGITDSMLVGQPSTASAMESLYLFIGSRPIIAHNATFDSKFLIAEMKRINKVVLNQFLCTLLISRRLLLTAGSYKLSSLKKFINFKSADSHKDHRALDDVLVTVALWNHLIAELSPYRAISDASSTIDLMRTISHLPKAAVASFLENKLIEMNGGEPAKKTVGSSKSSSSSRKRGVKVKENVLTHVSGVDSKVIKESETILEILKKDIPEPISSGILDIATPIQDIREMLLVIATPTRSVKETVLEITAPLHIASVCEEIILNETNLLPDEQICVTRKEVQLYPMFNRIVPKTEVVAEFIAESITEAAIIDTAICEIPMAVNDTAIPEIPIFAIIDTADAEIPISPIGTVSVVRRRKSPLPRSASFIDHTEMSGHTLKRSCRLRHSNPF